MMKSLNEHHGFYDGISRGAIASQVSGKLFAIAAQAVKEVFKIERDGDAAALLDSTFGRHLSDHVRDAQTEEELKAMVMSTAREKGFIGLAKRELKYIYETRRENGGASDYDQHTESVPALVASLLGESGWPTWSLSDIGGERFWKYYGVRHNGEHIGNISVNLRLKQIGLVPQDKEPGLFIDSDDELELIKFLSEKFGVSLKLRV